MRGTPPELPSFYIQKEELVVLLSMTTNSLYEEKKDGKTETEQ